MPTTGDDPELPQRQHRRANPALVNQYGAAADDYQWIIYDRISDDRTGDALGVERQKRLNLAAATTLGGSVLEVLVDNDMTAFSGSRRYKDRPGYTRLCQLLEERPGKRGVITWHSDRMHRTPRELEDFLDLVEHSQARVHTIQAGPIDLTTPGGRAMARQLCVMARYESEIKSARIRAKAVELADAGEIASGGPRPFGYNRIYAGEGPSRKILRDEINPEEAAVIRDLARRLIGGDTMRTLVRWLNSEGIKTTTDGPWSQQGLRAMLQSARIAGLREHHGQVVATAVWPEIITVEQHETLRQMLASNQRPPGSRVRLHYLSGLVYCSDCVTIGVKMRAGTHHQKLKYKCPADSGGCNGRVIGLADLEKFIGELLVAKLSDPQTLREIADRDADKSTVAATLADQIEADERRLALLQEALDDEAGDEEELPELVTSVRRIRRRLRAAREQLALATGTTHPSHESLPDLAKRWPDLDLDQKRGLASLFIDKILIHPARRGLGAFDERRVQVVPVGQE